MPKGNGKISVNVVMGGLGAGKTTVILSLVRQIAGPDYRVIWLKNEFGDVNVDAALGREMGLLTREVMNGCLCCTALGNLEDAVSQVLELEPDRIIIETAGTAHPAPIAMELKRFPQLVIDSLVEVIDAMHFGGFTNHDIIRRSHAKYVDFVVLNKVGMVDERRLDDVLDEVLDIYPDTPSIRTADGEIPAETVIGIDQEALVRQLSIAEMEADTQRWEHRSRMQAFSYRSTAVFDRNDLAELVRSLPTRDIYRTKGVVRTPEGWQLMNGVLSRVTWQPLTVEAEQSELLFIGPYAQDHRATTEERLKRLERRS